MATDGIVLPISADTSEAEKSLKKFEGETSKGLQGISASFASLKTVATAAVAFFAGREIVQFFQAGIEASLAQEKSLKELSTALDLTGENSKEALDAFSAFADEIERTTNISDDVVLSQVAIAKSFGVSNDQAKELVQAAIELSAATGTDLEGNVRKLGLTLGGVTGKLDEQVPALKGLTKEQLRNGEAIKILQDRYGGSAAKNVQTFGGSVTFLTNQFGNFQEAIADSITQSKPLQIAIKSLGEFFTDLTVFVLDNKDSLLDFVKGGVQAALIGIDLLAGALKGLNSLLGVVVLATLQLGKTVAEVFTAIPRAIFGVFDDLVKTAEKNLGPFIKGTVFEGALKSVSQFNNDVKTVGESIGSTYDSIATDIGDTFESVNKGLEKVGSGAADVAGKIERSDAKIGDSAENAKAKRDKLGRGPFIDGEALEKARVEFKKFSDSITTQVGSESEQIIAKRSAAIKEAVRLGKESGASFEQIQAVQQQVFTKFEQDLTKVQEAESEKRKQITEKEFSDFKSKIEEASKNPLSIFIKTETSSISEFAGKFGEGIAGSIGAATSLLQGKEGAQKLISGAASAIGNAILPGIGGAVGPLVDLLAQGPEQTKAQIKAFVEAIPEIIDAIAESIPVLVETLIDVLVNKGGAVKIAVALAKAFNSFVIGEAIFKGVGKAIGLEVGSAFTGATIIKKFGDGIGKAFNSIASLTGKQVADTIRKAIVDSALAIPKAVISGLQALPGIFSRAADFFREKVLTTLQQIPTVLSEFFFTTVPNSIKSSLSSIGASVSEGIKSGVSEFVNQFKLAFSELGGGISQAFKDAGQALKSIFDVITAPLKATFDALKGVFENFKLPKIDIPKITLPEIKIPKITIPTPPWVDDLKDFLGNFSLPGFGGGGGGGGGGIGGAIRGALGLATGGVVPSGFPDDSFPALLTSAERVLTPAQNKMFESLLNQGATAPQNQGPITINLQVGEQQLAKVLVNLNKQGFRVA